MARFTGGAGWIVVDRHSEQRAAALRDWRLREDCGSGTTRHRNPCVASGFAGVLWIGVDTGLVRLDRAEPLPSYRRMEANVHVLLEYPAGTVWVAPTTGCTGSKAAWNEYLRPKTGCRAT